MATSITVDPSLAWLLAFAAVGLGATTTSRFGETASRQISREGGWAGFVQNFILGGIVLKLQYESIEGIDSFGGLLLAPVEALGNGMVRLVDATIGNVIVVFDAGTQATVLSFTDGVARFLGPLAQPLSVGVGMLSIAVFILMVNRLNISPLSFLQSLRN